MIFLKHSTKHIKSYKWELLLHQALNAHNTKENIFIHETSDTYVDGVVLVDTVFTDVLANDKISLGPDKIIFVFSHSLRFFSFWLSSIDL